MVTCSTSFIAVRLFRPEKQLLERRESLEEAEERRRQLAARLALGLEPGKRKPEEIPIPPAEAYIVTPHRKRRPGFHNAPAQNPAFVPFNPGFETPRRLQAPHPLSVSAPPYLVHEYFHFFSYNDTNVTIRLRTFMHFLCTFYRKFTNGKTQNYLFIKFNCELLVQKY